jgi:shikimate dehydrogenase
VLTGRTRLVGLIGNPVSDSLSPRMQNAAFAARGLDWAYVPLPVPAERLEAAALGLVGLGFAGANVTTPYKTAIISYCDELDGVAARGGSVNTLVVRDGSLLGSSTDGQAVVDAVEPAGASVLVLGAGGAAASLVVNTTPIRDEVLVRPSSEQLVVDLAYNADGRPTAFVAAARERGCQTVDGLEVIVAQGAASFERWTGVSAPVEVMRAALRFVS